MTLLFGKNEKKYKANLHCHTTYSDGRATPETVKEEYKKQGYSVVAFTDHQHLINMKHLSDEDFIAITACEMSIMGPKVDTFSPAPSGKQMHISFFAKNPDCDITPCYSASKDWYKFDDVRHLVKSNGNYSATFSTEGINEMVKIGHEMGFLVSLNHPAWSLLTAKDYLDYDGFDFIEVHNSGSLLSGFNENDQAFDEIMKTGKKIMPVATDDNHNIFGFDGSRTDSFRGWIMLDTPKLDYENVISAMENGDFYASAGPEIHSIAIDDDGILRVECSPVKRAYMISQGRHHAQEHAPEGETKTSLAFKFRVCDVSFRIRIEDENGNCAWSRIYDIPEGTHRVDAEPPKA